MRNRLTEGLGSRSTELAHVVLTVLVDLAFLGTMVVVNWAAQTYVFERLDLHGTAKFTLTILDWAFAVSTVGAVLTYLVRDTLVAIARPWRKGR